MDRAALLAHFAQAKALIASGEEHVARQKELTHKLNRDGPGGINCKEYLHFLEGMQALHVEYRDKLKRELNAIKRE